VSYGKSKDTGIMKIGIKYDFPINSKEVSGKIVDIFRKDGIL
jgi:hypothetical protein